jgi:hypothetical protein
MRLPLFIFGLVAAVTAPARAADLREIEVARVDGNYLLHSVVWFDAGIETVYHVFLDWDLSEQFSSVVVEARNTGSDANGDRGFYTRNRACVLFYCMSVERRGRVEHEPVRLIKAITDPEASDFHLSNETWEFEEEGEGTLITYQLEMRPKFWIPPVIGPYVLKKKLRDDGANALDRIEAIAQDRERMPDAE